MDIQLTLSERDAAKALGLSTRTLERLRKKGELRFFKIGGRVKYRLEALEDWAKLREQQTTSCDARVTT